MKRNEDSLHWDNIKRTNILIIGVTEEEEKEKGPEKIFEEIKVKNFPNIGKEIVTQVQKAQSPIQDKPKEEQAETHVNLTKKIQYKDKNIKSSKGKATDNVQGNAH